jgi:agmatinase
MATTPRLQGCRALVTGAGQGIGRAIATRLAAEGATVAVNDLREDERVTALVDEIGGVPAVADVSDAAAVAAMVERLGDVDVLVVNHAYMSMGPLEDYDLDDWWRVVDTNLGGTFHLVQAVLPGMRRGGFGRIVVISSEWGVVGWPGATAYSAAKAGLVSLTKTLGRELAPEGIIVNAVAPGVVDTPQLEVDADAEGIAREEMVARYAGHTTFARLPRIEDVPRHDVAVVGVPFDSGVTYRPGARFGPSYIRQGSRLLRPYNPALDVAPFAGVQVVDAGDIAANPFDIPAALAEIDAGVRELSSDGRPVVLLGGDHTVALPALRALHAQHGPLAMVHFDAHLDTWDTYFGAPYTHGTPFRRAAEEGLIDAARSLHVGIRGPLYAATDLEESTRLGYATVNCSDYDRLGLSGVVDAMRERLGTGPVYVSVDIDVIDPGMAPGTGTPEAGGLTSRELLTTLRGLAGLDVVSADIVEVSPAYDHAEVTGIAAAHVAYELLSVMAGSA